jgi:hypothetical protein
MSFMKMFFVVVELANLHSGIDEEIAQRLVFLADLGAAVHASVRLRCGCILAGLGWGWRGRRVAEQRGDRIRVTLALTEQFRKLAHLSSLAPVCQRMGSMMSPQFDYRALSPNFIDASSSATY